MTGALTNLARSASFSRRKRSTAESAKAPPPVTKQGSTSVVSRVIRTASFSRRSSRNSGAANREGTTSEESNSSSPTDSRCVSPDNDESSAPLSAKLAGWLLKRHTSEKTIGAQWARRYLHVNEVRGTISMSKGPKKTASAVLPLCDIKSVTVSELSDETGPNCFVISCPPVHLTVRADSPEECRMWIRQLRLRADAWRAKSNPVVSARVAGSVEPQGQSQSQSLPSQGHVEYERTTQQNSTVLMQPRSPYDDDASLTMARSPNKRAGRNESFSEADSGRSPVVESQPEPTQRLAASSRPPPLPQSHLESVRSLAAPSPVELTQLETVESPIERTELETVELLSDDDSDDDGDNGVERAAWGQFAQGAPTVGRTDGNPTLTTTPPSSSRALPPPRDLEAMMSSEDEEEEEEAPPPRAQPVRRKPEQAPEQAPSVFTPREVVAATPRAVAEVEAAGAGEAAGGGGGGGGMSWLSSMPDTAYDAAGEEASSPELAGWPSSDETVDHTLTARYSPSKSPSPAPAPARRAQYAPSPEAAPLPELQDAAPSPEVAPPPAAPPPPPPVAANYDDWDEDEDDEAPAPAPATQQPAERAPVGNSIGNGIQADDNFADSDWDDDDDE
jgi:hypothetical protein